MKEKNPLVSVVSVFYNREDSVQESVDSIISQSFTDYEIILIDDGSTDNTLDELRKYEGCAGVKILTHANLGFVSSVVRGISEAAGDFIAIHGAGDISYKNRLKKQVKFLIENPSAGIVGCHYKNINEEKTQEVIVKPLDVVNREDFSSGFMFSQGELMYRRKAYDCVGGYRSIFTVGQGTDLWRRIVSSGWHALVIKEVLYERSVRSDGVSTDPSKLAKRIVLSAISDSDIDCDGSSKYISKDGVVGILYSGMNHALAMSCLKAGIKLSAWGCLDEAKKIAKVSVRVSLLYYPALLFVYYPFLAKIILNKYGGNSFVLGDKLAKNQKNIS